MNVLVLGSSSFAAQELPQYLKSAGHDVWTFNRTPLSHSTPNDLDGSYEQLSDIVCNQLSSCDVLINYAIVKHGTIEQNLALTNHILACARRLEVKRFIHVSSISVLPSISGAVDERTEAVEGRWKGSYSRVKAAVERYIIQDWNDSELVILRPGFILAPGLIDSMVGIGKRLPTGQVLGFGNRKSIIPLIDRIAVNQSIVTIVGKEIVGRSAATVYMLVAKNAPSREEYLRFQCRELGRGWKPIHFPSWIWRAGLTLGSVPLSFVKRKPVRLVKLFEHNLRVRLYDCAQTQQALGLEFEFDWKEALRKISRVGSSSRWPGGSDEAPFSTPANMFYYGLGRIVRQRHLPALASLGFRGRIQWCDPALTEAPRQPRLQLEPRSGTCADASHAVVAVPWTARANVIDSLPSSVSNVLFEKPFAVSRRDFEDFKQRLSGRRVVVIHNYRFKSNVLQFRNFLEKHASGALRAVRLHYETPSPFIEQSAWMRRERPHRILLTDYALHFLDLAWLFCHGPLNVLRCHTEWNDRDELESISADLSFSGVPCDVLIRQGCHQRQCVIDYHFQNYSTQLRFFPDVFIPIMGGHSPLDDARLSMAGFWGAGRKVLEKLAVCAADRSHELVLASFTGQNESCRISELSVESLTPFYERLTDLADVVYEQAHGSP